MTFVGTVLEQRYKLRMKQYVPVKRIVKLGTCKLTGEPTKRFSGHAAIYLVQSALRIANSTKKQTAKVSEAG